MNIEEFIKVNDIPYRYIWVYMKEGEIDKKKPIGEKNDKSIDEIIKEDREQVKAIKPKTVYVDKKIYTLTDKEYESLFLCYSLYVKYVPYLYCIDVDDPKINNMEEMNKRTEVFKDCVWTEGNKKGIHIYVYINDLPEYKNQQKVFNKFIGDLIKINNMWERTDKELKSFNGKNEITNLKYEEIKGLLNENFQEINKTDDTKKKVETKDMGIIDRNKIEINFFKKYLKGLSNKRSDEYNYWKQVIWIINNVAKDNKWSIKERDELIHKFSSRSDKYNETETNEFIENNIKENGELGLGTLILWNKEDMNKEEIDYSERGMAELFLRHNPNTMISQEGNMYIYYNNEWHNDIRRTLCKYVVTDRLIYYIKIENDEIDKILKKQLKEDNEDPKIKVIKKKQNNIIQYLNKLKTIKFIGDVLKQIEIKLSSKLSKIVFDLGEEQKYNIHFKNGLYDLKKKEFRKRIYEDYITQYLDYDYIESEKIDEDIHKFVYDFFKKIQPDEEERDFTLGYLAYCITGNTGEQIFKINIGYSASNGKSTEIKIHEKCFDIYTTKLNKQTFNMNNSKVHKYLHKCLHNPIRLAYIEELDRKLLDADLLKDWIDGSKITNEILYGTCEDMPIQAKVMTFSNKDMVIEGDPGIYRRGRVQMYESRFDKDIEDNYETHKYRKILNFEGYFDNIEYKNAYFHLLLRYIDKLKIPKEAEEKFKEIIDENDTIKTLIEDYYIITRDENDIISKNEIINNIENVKWKDVLSKLKSMGGTYKKDYRATDGSKGVITGIRKI